MENKKVSTDQALNADLYGATAYIRDEPQCPANGTYTIGIVSAKAACTVAGHTL